MIDFLVHNGAGLLFYLFALLAVGSAAAVVSLRNPMYCALSLLVTFLSIAGLFLLREAEFVAVVQVFVYGGGIMVLFLFVIMLVNLHRLREVRLFVPQRVAAGVLAALLVGLFTLVFVTASFGPPVAAAPDPAGEPAAGNSLAVAMRLYREYLLPFEVASLFLLVAMIGAVVLGRRD